MAARIETFVIHLERAKGRRAQVDALLKSTPYPAHILPAVDGAKIPAQDRAMMLAEQPMFEPTYPFILRDGELGCFQSHRAAWLEIVENDLDAGLVFEDDVALVDGFATALAMAEKHVVEFGYIQFQVRPVPPGEVLAKDAGISIIRPHVTPLRAAAQLISRQMAERLLEMTVKFDRPVDTFLQSHWYTGMPMVCVSPSGVVERSAEIGGSTISQRKSLFDKLTREYKRWRYRAAVKRLSQQ